MQSPFSPKRRKIGPQYYGNLDKSHNGPATEPTDKAKAELNAAGLEFPNQTAMRHYRLNRVISELKSRNLMGILLFDPVNIRYALDARNMSIWTSRNFARAAFVDTDGYIVLWDFDRCEHLTQHLPLISEHRTGAGAYYFAHGDRESDYASRFAAQIADLYTARNKGTLAVDRMDLDVITALQAQGVSLTTGQVVMEHARLIKGPDEIKAMRCAAHACQLAVAEMEDALQAGLSEVELWSVMHAGNIARGGEWIETRLLASGPRTNPWMAEAGPRILEDGDVLAFDTDMIGLYGYICDMSRTWLVGNRPASDEQIRLYRAAYDHIMTNTGLLHPGVSFRDLTFKGDNHAPQFQAHQYCVKMHGVGLCDEFPSIYYPNQFIDGAADYELAPGMVLSVEVFVGEIGGKEGIKLENEVLITENGHEVLTTYPFDKHLLGQS